MMKWDYSRREVGIVDFRVYVGLNFKRESEKIRPGENRPIQAVFFHRSNETSWCSTS